MASAAEIPGTDPQFRAARRAIRSLVRATKQVKQYPPGHPVLNGLMEGLQQALLDTTAPHMPLTVTTWHDQIFIGDAPLTDPHPEELQLGAELRRRGIRRIRFDHQLETQHLEGLVRALAEDPSGRSENQIRGLFNTVIGSGVSVQWIDYSALEVAEDELKFTEEQRAVMERMWELQMGLDEEDYERLIELLGDADASMAILLEGAEVLEELAEEEAEEEGEEEEKIWRPPSRTQLSALDIRGWRIASTFQRVFETVMGRRPEDWQSVRRFLTDILVKFPPRLQNAVFRSPRPEGEDVLREIAGLLAPGELAIVLIPDVKALLAHTSDELERVVQRLVPDTATWMVLDEQARRRLEELDIPPRLYANAVQVLGSLDAVQREASGAAVASRAVRFNDLLEETGDTTEPRGDETWEELEQLRADSTLEFVLRVTAELLVLADTPPEYEALSRRLVSLCQDAPLPISPSALLDLEEVFSMHRSGGGGNHEWRQGLAQKAIVELWDAEINLDPGRVSQLAPRDRIRLLSIAGPSAAAQVAELLLEKDDPRLEEPATRRAAAAALVSLGSGGDLAVRELLAGRELEEVREVLELLAAAGDPDPGRFLERHAGNPSWLIRLGVAQVLSRFPGPGACLLLERLVRDPDETVREAAIEGLGFMHEPAAYARLTALARGEGAPSSSARAQAVRALGRQRRAESVPLLIELLDKTSFLFPGAIDELRVAAAEALGNFETPEARQALNRGAGDKRQPVADACRKSIEQMSKQQ